MRYSLEYCGRKYLIVERSQNKIIFESTNSKECFNYMKNNNLKFIDEEVLK
jgi:hypothetical protein